MAANPATRALILAASASVAPIRFAMRVDAAMEMGNGILDQGFAISIVYSEGECRALEHVLSRKTPKTGLKTQDLVRAREYGL